MDSYLWDKVDEVSVESAKTLHNPDRPLPEYGVLIPIAAHQESARVYHSMREYAKQEGASDFAICLHINYPADQADNPQVEATVEAVKQAQTDFPQLDIRYIQTAYAESATIGQIRKDLWDPVAVLARAEGIYDHQDGEFIAINHDIDTESIGKHYIRNIQRYYQQDRLDQAKSYYPDLELEARATQVKHAYPFETHPNIAKVILWRDFTHRQAAPNGLYEEGMVIPMSMYAKAGGFLPEKQTYETESLTRSAIKGDKMYGIRGTAMDTSSRRYIDRLDERGYTGIWSDDTFGANDNCRDNERLPGDISFNRMEEIIFDDLDQGVSRILGNVPVDEWSKLGFDYMLQLGMSEDELSERVATILRPKIKLARAVLARITESSLLPSLVDESLVQVNTNEFVSSIKKNYSWLDSIK